jgi:AcrR family transcriptional regulator
MGASCDGRKGHILEAADRLLRRLGPARTTVADIAREAQVGVGSVYLEFSSKDAIINALSSARHDGVLGAMRAAATTEGGLRRRVEAIFEARVEAFLALRQEGDHAPELVHCVAPAVRAAHDRYCEEERALLCEVLTLAREAGELGPFEPAEAAASLLRCYASFAPPFLYLEAEGPLRAALKAMHRVVLDGLLVRPSSPG